MPKLHHYLTSCCLVASLSVAAPVIAGEDDARPWTFGGFGAQLGFSQDRWSAVVQVVLEHKLTNSYSPLVEWANIKYQAAPDLIAGLRQFGEAAASLADRYPTDGKRATVLGAGVNDDPGITSVVVDFVF